MRGADVTQEDLFVTRKTADLVPAGHPSVAIREAVNTALRDLDMLFESIYDERGRHSVPPEWLLRGLVLQALYGIRSERLLCGQLGYNMLYRWFVGLSMADAGWDHSTYTKNRDRLIEHEVVRGLFGRVMQQAKDARLLSDEHFSVDGTLIRAWASHKSFVPKDGPPPPSSGSRSKLAVDVRLTQATGTAEIEAALEMLGELPGAQAKTAGTDKNFDTTEFVIACRELNVSPHVAQNTYEYDTRTGKRARRRSRIDGRNTRHPGCAVSQVIRKMIETLFGDSKQHGGTIRQVKLRGLAKVSDVFTLAMLAATATMGSG